MINVRMHWFSLRFIDVETECLYEEYDFNRLVFQCRIAILVGLFCYLLIGVFDPYLFSPEDQAIIWQIRLTGPLIPLGVFVLSFTPAFKRYNAFPMSFMGLAGGVCILLMSLYLTADKVSFYYPFLIAVIFITYNLIGTRFIYALGIDICLMVAFNLTVLFRGDSSLVELGIHNYYLVVSNLIGGSAGYLTELQRRKLFISEMTVWDEIHKAQAARSEADRANEAKSRFLAAISHDLRQPIHAQGLFLNMLANSPLKDEQKLLLSHIEATSEAANELLHSLMDFSRIEAGSMKPTLAAFPLQSLFNKIEIEFLPQAEERGLVYHCRDTDVVLHSDPKFIEIILRNLISNAIRYTHSGGILLGCRKRGERVVLEVRDTGIGIEASQQNEIFKEFQQLGNPERDRRKGLGLGLAIVEGLARTLNHPLSVNSTPGRGSVFRLTVPIAAGHESIVDACAVKHHQIEIIQRPRTGIRILFIDDDEIVRLGTQQQLLAWGFDCDAVESIDDAHISSSQRPPDLIISDYRLRDHATGIQAIEAIRLRLDRPNLPALVITGDNAPERRKEAQAIDIKLLHKPVAANVLYRNVIGALEVSEGEVSIKEAVVL
ncbi:MAG: hybrid sensor histidine kinase/response regulator [Amphritea sp.]|nr:hybrid sensor histidine kinase/response regulator [Amphritea sp.]